MKKPSASDGLGRSYYEVRRLADVMKQVGLSNFERKLRWIQKLLSEELNNRKALRQEGETK